MRKITFLLFCLSTLLQLQAQKKTCDTPKEDIFEDLNSITKCTVEKKKGKNKKSRQNLSVSVSASKRRFLMKRNLKKDKVDKLGNLDISGVNNKAAKSLALKNKIASITKTISSEELKKAEKFSTVASIPAFDKCKSIKGEERSECFSNEMIKHIESYFNYPDEAIVKKIEGQVWVRFIIDVNGNVANIKALGPKNGTLLEEEAIRVASHLPKLIPGKKDGKNVPVKYGFPINFSLSE